METPLHVKQCNIIMLYCALLVLAKLYIYRTISSCCTYVYFVSRGCHWEATSSRTCYWVFNSDRMINYKLMLNTTNNHSILHRPRGGSRPKCRSKYYKSTMAITTAGSPLGETQVLPCGHQIMSRTKMNLTYISIINLQWR